MADFQRALPPHARGTVRSLASGKCWMRDLLAKWAPSGTRGSLRLAVRHDYVNFYHLGQSVSKVKFPTRAKPTATVHHKYVIRKAEGQTYIKIDATEGLDGTGKRTQQWGGAKTLDSWIAKAASYANVEKGHIDSLLNVSPNVIDLEIALPARHGEHSAPRIDIAALEDASDSHPARVVFWEVKRINDPRLRSRSVPEVLGQLRRYKDYVASSPRLFKVAYRQTCAILSQFHDIACCLWDSPQPLDRVVSDVANGGSLEVDVEPRLLIIEDEHPKRNWEHHRDKLTNGLGDRVHFASPGQAIPRALRGPA